MRYATASRPSPSAASPTHDASIGHFNSVAIEWVAILFMVLSGINFGLHFTAWRSKNLAHYARDREVRLYLLMLAAVAFITAALLSQHPDAVASPIRHGLFQAVSITTHRGLHHHRLQFVAVGGAHSADVRRFRWGLRGSTAGGMKMIRVLLVYRQCVREIKRLIHPLGVFPLKLGGNRVPNRVADAIWAFCIAYVLIFVALSCLVMGLSGLDFLTAFSAVAACLNNLGPGLGEGGAELPRPAGFRDLAADAGHALGTLGDLHPTGAVHPYLLAALGGVADSKADGREAHERRPAALATFGIGIRISGRLPLEALVLPLVLRWIQVH